MVQWVRMGTLKRYEIRVDERRIALETGLQRLLEVCRGKRDIRAVYVFGSLASGKIGPTSDLDILVVRETDVPYHDRGDDLRIESRPGVRLDLIVVTPEEYRERLHQTGFGRTILSTARRVYAA